MHLTTKERILLYLLEHPGRGEATEASPALTREAIARASRINTRHLPQYLRPLLGESLVVERQAHVQGIRQRRKVYDLTEAGRRKARQLREELSREIVQVRDASGRREVTVAQVLETTHGEVPISGIVTQAMEEGGVDLDALRAGTRTPYLEMLSDAPRIEKFAGRRAELRTILQESGPHQMFVIQGVAGIGKSSLAAKVCELERGTRNILWHRVRTWDTHQTMFAVIGEFLRALDRPGLVSALKRGDANRAAEILREDLPGTRSLLVFDDVHEGSRDVLSFLALLKDAIAGAPDAQVLVLTRRSLSFYDPRDTALTGLVREIDLSGLEPQDVAAMFAGQGAPPGILEASRRLHGHPLLCQLLLAAGPRRLPSLLPRDVHRFIEGHIYEGLTPEEATAMKTISLFQVPAPRSAILSNPKTTAQAFQSLLRRFLIRPVGEEAFEVHDTIRDFFLDSLSLRDREELSPLVLEQLKRLAERARNVGEFAACVGCLSNAVKLTTSTAEKTGLHEALGDANGRLGDVGAAVVSYKLCAKTTKDPETLLRLRRKTAEVLLEHGELGSALKEADAAIQAIGDRRTAERGWLQLVRCRISVERDHLDDAEERAADALQVLTDFEIPRGQAEALLELGRVELLRGRPEVVDSARLASALELATRLGDPELVANIHLAMADLAHLRFADPNMALDHFCAVEAIPSALADPVFACRYFWLRGGVKSLLLDDQPGAMQDYTEALRLARRAHDTAGAGQARFGLGLVHLCTARFAEAREEFERVVAIFEADALANLIYSPRWLIAQCCLFLGDFAGFRTELATMDEVRTTIGKRGRASSAGTDMGGYGLVMALHGFDHLLKGDPQRCREAFREALRTAESEWARRSLTSDSDLPSVLVWFGIALRAMGYGQEGDEYFSRGLELFRARHLEGGRSLFESAAIQEVQLRLRREWEGSHRGAGRKVGAG